jgi:HrpA-like RNA helicase
VNRSPEIQKSRLKLPILAEEQAIMKAVNENFVVISLEKQAVGRLPKFLSSCMKQVMQGLFLMQLSDFEK